MARSHFARAAAAFANAGLILAALLAALSAIVLAGCAAPLPTTELPPARFIAPVPEFPGLRDYRGIFDFRIGATGLDQAGVADLAKEAQIDFIIPGDRIEPGSSDYGIPGFTSTILFIAGGAFESGGGRIIGVNLHEPIHPDLSTADLISAIRDQGGLAIAAQPAKFTNPADFALADGIEVYNQRDTWLEQSPAALYLRAIFTNTDKFLASLDVRPDVNLAFYDRIAAGARVTMLAGLGAPDDLTVLGSKVGTTPQLMLFYTTHLLARERDQEPLVEALKLGHSYVSFDFLGYVGQFTFFAQTADANTGSKALMGDEVRFAPGMTLKAELPDAADRIAMYQNGAEVASAENARNLEFAPKSAGAYRIEAYRGGHMWILSNPVYVR
ncbi:MAG: hypothetical protein Q7S58_03185 [Candidatus Binatus sp.]|uniref:hypothetical protein n=1 Tax=Candidatus Binatus sp. TaxID=2811406 RepID=UPI002716BE29|nr:hypothetical protein [Candidatus Binatus sp.]MDO8431393.1 hypothetical protein [Candidatus Binatus sp.]